MKAFKLFFMFSFLLVILFSGCDSDEDKGEEPITFPPCEIIQGLVYVQFDENELSNFNVINSNDLGLSMFAGLYFDSKFSKLGLDEDAIRAEMHKLNEEYSFVYFSNNIDGIAVHFSEEIRNEANQRTWNLLKKELELKAKENALIQLTFDVPVGEEENWIKSLQKLPNVKHAGYSYAC